MPPRPIELHPHPRRLLLSLHDVTPAHAERTARLSAVLERHGGAGRFAMLVVPNFHGQWPLSAHPDFRAWLRGRAEAGIEIFLHGLRHLDDARHAGGLSRWKARVMTAGEGEFLGLGLAEASRRLRDGRAEVEDIIGRPVAGFVAPAWLYGPGAMAAIAEQGFPLAEDHFKVWRPADGQVVARGPVVTYATRTRARLLSSLAVSRAATLGLGFLPTLRLAVHPHDADSPAVMGELDRALTAHLRRRAVGRYADLTAAAA